MSLTEEKKWKKFENLVEKIQSSLAPQATITTNDKVKGKTSKTVRQIDIAIKHNIGNYRIFIAVECKDHKDPIDVSEVEKFISKLRDVEANKGVIVSASGFTKAAKNVAFDAGVEVYRLVDTREHEWKADVSIPVLCDFRKIKRTSFTYKSSIPGPLVMETTDPMALMLYRENGSLIDTVYNVLIDEWNKGRLPIDPGRYENLKLLNIPTCIKHEGNLQHMEVLGHIEVYKVLHFGHLPIDIEGFEDQKNGGIITSGIQTKELDVDEVEKTWKQIESEEELAVKPVIIFKAVDNYPKMKLSIVTKAK